MYRSRRLPGRQGVCGAARRQHRLCRRRRACGAGGISRLSRRQADLRHKRRACTGSWLCVPTSARKRGDLDIVKGRTIGAAPGSIWASRPSDRGRDRSGARQGQDRAGAWRSSATCPNFGVMAAQALEDGKLDGFWANGMGAEVAVRGGYGTVVIDVRRGDGPKAAFNFTAATIATTDALIARSPDTSPPPCAPSSRPRPR